MKVISEETQDDASAWAAVVEVAGVKFRAVLVASKLSVGLVPYKPPPRSPRWALKAVTTWATGRVNELTAAWMDLHRQLYAGEGAA